MIAKPVSFRLRKLFCAALLLVLCAGPVLCADIAVYHTTDAHGFYFQRNINGKETGGYAALAAVLKKETLPYLLFDSGDFAAGSYDAAQSKGALSVDFINMLGYTALTIGNHEGDFGQAAFLKIIAGLKPDILAANIYDAKTQTYPAGIKPYNIYEIAGKKIAVIGLAKDPLPQSPDIKTRRGAKELRKALGEVKKQSPDVVILLYHGSAADTLYASGAAFTQTLSKMPGLDLVLGGHAHKIVENLKINNVTFVESGADLKGASRVILTFNDNTGKLENIKSAYILLDIAKTGQDAAIKKFAAAHYNKEIDAPLGEIKETIRKYNPRAAEGAVDSPLGNLFTDILKEHTGADIAMQNTEGIRADLPAGIATKRMVFDIFPFQDKVMVIKADGRLIKKLALKSLRKDRSLFQYSGLTLKYRWVNDRPEITQILINNKPLETKKVYTIAISDFNGLGNGEGYLFKDLPDKQFFGTKQLSDLLQDYITNNKAGISAPETGRLQRIP